MIYYLSSVWQGFTLLYNYIFFFFSFDDVWIHIYLPWMCILFVVETLIRWTLSVDQLRGNWTWNMCLLMTSVTAMRVISLRKLGAWIWVECRKVLMQEKGHDMETKICRNLPHQTRDYHKNVKFDWNIASKTINQGSVMITELDMLLPSSLYSKLTYAGLALWVLFVHRYAGLINEIKPM